MRKFLALMALASAALLAGASQAGDLYEDPEMDIPGVDEGLGGAFYLRGSVALNLHWAAEVAQPLLPETTAIDRLGYGYSWGAGFGYESGEGLRYDATIDQVETSGIHFLRADGGPDDGDYTLRLRSTVALANAYYDFGFGGDSFAYTGNGGGFGYVGAGVGIAWNHVETSSPPGITTPSGSNLSAAGAVMAGVGYDMGDWVADLGYRALYIRQVNNAPTTAAADYLEVNNNWIHEIRGTGRFRFN